MALPNHPQANREQISDADTRAHITFTMNSQMGVILLSFLLLWVSIAHSLEDFVYGIPARFGLSVVTAALVLGAAYVVQVTGILLASKHARSGYMITFATGAVWAIAAAADHLKEVLTVWPYREGVLSKLLEVGIMLVGAALAVISLVVLLSRNVDAVRGQ
ncbi:MAG TPA: hypothetical protein DHW02_12100 [Ktedonobacter sp.]|nr:hypothetical protein [Ktedonobacter sp.]